MKFSKPKQIFYGGLWHNDEVNVPFGGVKHSGMGRQNGKYSVEAFSELRWFTLERGGRQYPPPFNEKL
jgi:acyl-CoA reductase-like NAD-dependent aldehyde dehydrogenase